MIIVYRRCGPRNFLPVSLMHYCPKLGRHTAASLQSMGVSKHIFYKTKMIMSCTDHFEYSNVEVFQDSTIWNKLCRLKRSSWNESEGSLSSDLVSTSAARVVNVECVRFNTVNKVWEDIQRIRDLLTPEKRNISVSISWSYKICDRMY